MLTSSTYLAEELDGSMVKIPAGKSIFGLRDSQRDELAARSGVHWDMLRFHAGYRETEVDEFWMDRHPVTRGQFRRFLAETGYKMVENGWLAGWAQLTNWHEFSPEADACPMVGVNADDACAYAEWCGKRLPTEVEWEKAWRGGDGRLFPWGNEWMEGFAYRNPGNISLKPALPVGRFGETGPHGLSSYGLVLEWVKSLATAQDQGYVSKNPWVLAGGSFLHAMDYSFCPTNRSSWSPSMRIYNSGFRCASDAPPRNLVREPKYRPSPVPLPQPVAMRPDLYGKEAIELIPTDQATVSIKVPWFPESVWVLDCPEARWGDFGGANAWPTRPEKEWRIPWKISQEGRKLSYAREKGEQRQEIEIWVEGDTVHYRYDVKNIAPIPGSFCFKTFSPFFTSQERRAQVMITPQATLSCQQQPLAPDTGASLAWSLPELFPPDRLALESFDKTARILFPVRHQQVSGNGCYPCVHIHPRGDGREDGNGLPQGGGSMTFSLR